MCCGCYSAPEIDAAPIPEDDRTPLPYRLGPSDLVRVTFFGLPDYSTSVEGVRIDTDGYLSLPGIAPIYVAGKQHYEAREAILAAASVIIRNPRMSFSVIEYGARNYFVFGEVEEPGPYILDRPVTALEALAHAGGFGSGASRDRVAVLRPDQTDGPHVLFFDGETPGVDGLFYLRPNDLVFVPQSSAGRLRDQVLPIIQAISSSVGLITTFSIVADTLED